MKKAGKIILLIFLILLLIVVTAPILLGLTGSVSKPGGGSTRKQISRLIARNFRTEVPDIPQDEKGYYYEQLDKTGQKAYLALYQGVTADETEIEVPGSRLSKIEKAWNALMNDHPEFFWLTGGIETTTHEPPVGRNYSVVEPEWTCSQEEALKRRQEVESIRAQYLEKYGGSGSEYDKIKTAYDYIVDTTEYDKNAPDNQNLYSVMVNGKSVCAGYSKTFQYLMKSQGILCLYVTGTDETNKDPHAWNIVQCGGKYYHVDVTWGDPLYADTKTSLPEDMRIINYDYLCCTDKEIAQTHTTDDDFELPVCNADDLNYYKNAGCYYDSYDPDVCRRVIYRDIDDRKDVTIFKFANRELYNKAHDDLTGRLFKDGANRILANTGMSRVYTYYQDEKEMNKIVLYWQYQ